ncbi:MAG: 16S rRNA (cytosine(1402)-N(4))-methyltransferase RsmH [Aerococcus sp.]|nr:16S rRNA (cytosine(1402)-N(4))-methyltransferase RsmH [Aerococcus sp.]
MTKAFKHVTVLLNEAVDQLAIKSDGIYVDMTLGGGGHTAHLLEQLSAEGRVIAFDQDETAIKHAKERFANEIEQGHLQLIHKNFRYLKETLAALNIAGVDGILYDLGVSSPQFDDVKRGFTYRYDAPLDMRMDQTQPLTAKTVVNEWSFNDLVRIFKRYGEERFAKPIARAIEKRRSEHPITHTLELVELIKEGIPAAARRTGGHPAKRVFQAIRIAVNDELGAIEDSLEQALEVLNPSGRVAVITFQSLEDRIVKVMFKEASTVEEIPSNIPILPEDLPTPDFELVTKKPIYPSTAEQEQNPRSHSAKLRVLKRI